MACREKQAFFHRASRSTEKDSDAGGLLLYVHDTAAAELEVTSWHYRDKKAEYPNQWVGLAYVEFKLENPALIKTAAEKMQINR